MYTSLCRYLRLLPLFHTPILLNKIAAPSMLTVNLVGIFIFVGVNTILREINLAISNKAGCISDLLTEWKII